MGEVAGVDKYGGESSTIMDKYGGEGKNRVDYRVVNQSTHIDISGTHRPAIAEMDFKVDDGPDNQKCYQSPPKKTNLRAVKGACAPARRFGFFWWALV